MNETAPATIDQDATPSQGGSYTRQPDGSLVRNQEPDQTDQAEQE